MKAIRMSARASICVRASARASSTRRCAASSAGSLRGGEAVSALRRAFSVSSVLSRSITSVELDGGSARASWLRDAAGVNWSIRANPEKRLSVAGGGLVELFNSVRGDAGWLPLRRPCCCWLDEAGAPVAILGGICACA